MKRWLLLFVWLLAAPVLAHKPSDAYLTLEREGTALTGQWDIALRDLDNVLGLDANGDGDITWGEVRARHADIAAYALARLRVAAAGQPCPLTATAQLDRHAHRRRIRGAAFVGPMRRSGADARRSTTRCSGTPIPSIAAAHFVEQGRAAAMCSAPIAAPGDRRRCGRTVWRQFATYLHEGVWHIWLGFDHILFLVSLLLPAVLVRREHAWHPPSRSAQRSSTWRRWSRRSRSRTRSRCRSPRWAWCRCRRAGSNRRSHCRSCSRR
jgi:hypothetical protein